MNRVRSRLSAIVLATTLGAAALGTAGSPALALGNPPIPKLTFDHTITSHPFTGAQGNASDIEGLGFVPPDTSTWVADDNADRVWEMNPTTGAYKSQLRGGNPSSNPANIDFTTATQVGTGLTCGDPTLVDATFLDVTGATQVDSANYECLSRTDDFESVIYDPTGDVLYVTSGNCCTAGFPAVYVDNDSNPATPPVLASYPSHPTVWKLTRDGAGHFVPTSWQALPEGQDPTAAGWRPGTGMYHGKSNKIRTYDFATNTLGSQITLGVSNIVGITFTDANTAFVTTASVDTSLGRTTATSDSTIHRFDISGSTWTENTAWKFPLKGIGQPAGTGGTVDTDGMIDARDLSIVSSGGVDTFYVSDGYDGRSSGDHPIYVYTLVDSTPPPPPPPPPGTGSWKPWEPLAGTVTSGPASSSWGPNRIDAFVRGSDGNLWHQAFAGQWSGWDVLNKPSGGFTGDPAAVSWAVGRIDVFVRGTDDHLWHKAYAGQWYGWEDLGGTLASSPAVSSMGLGRLDVFAKATDGQLQHKYFTGTSWSSWEKLGGQLSADPGAVSWGANRIDVFVRGTDNHLWHKYFAGFGWSAWEPLGGGLGSGTGVSSWGPGRLDVFVVGTDNQLWHKFFFGSGWSGWEPLGGTSTSDPDATSWSVNRVDLFTRRADNQLWHRAFA